MSIIRTISTIFGLLIFISFFGIFISIFTFPHLRIGTHNFNTPAVLFLLLLLGFLVNFMLKPILKEESGLKTKFSSGVGYWAIIGLLLIFIVVFGYFILYLPFKSVYLTEFNFQDTNSVKINADRGMLIFLEIDSGADTMDGTQLQINLMSASFNISSNAVIGKQSTSDRVNHKRTSSSTNNLVFMREVIPLDDEYTLTIQKISGSTSISNVRVYGKNTP